MLQHIADRQSWLSATIHRHPWKAAAMASLWLFMVFSLLGGLGHHDWAHGLAFGLIAAAVIFPVYGLLARLQRDLAAAPQLREASVRQVRQWFLIAGFILALIAATLLARVWIGFVFLAAGLMILAALGVIVYGVTRMRGRNLPGTRANPRWMGAMLILSGLPILLVLGAIFVPSGRIFGLLFPITVVIVAAAVVSCIMAFVRPIPSV